MANPVIIPMPAAREPKQGEGLLSPEAIAIIQEDQFTVVPSELAPQPSKTPLVIAMVGMAVAGVLGWVFSRQKVSMTPNSRRKRRK
jgi:hypothetical protein